MFPLDILFTYLAACLVVVLAPGPDNILAISRGLSQGRVAACLSSAGAGLGIMFHTVAAALGLSLVIQASPVAFWVVKAAGGLYLLWLGYKALASRDMISFVPSSHQPLRKVFLTGLLSNVLNPKPGLFVLAFLPQFVNAGRGSVTVQMLVYGAIFAVMSAVIFSILGSWASKLSLWLQRRPRVGTGLNVGAGLTFIASGLSVLALKQRA
ncbi:LysE family translocator [Variovorax sp. J2P1-59]|uniref:LysE family translocator n=1 Tax=Variovorax flavidus TaxID=3053501 RepID=UPI0025760DEC|nr:LysE family translocator [Variovorax sp. J2P1-59]MDM0076653.1 LysE family translocator [Variovorax sp. J2P1-59]